MPDKAVRHDIENHEPPGCDIFPHGNGFESWDVSCLACISALQFCHVHYHAWVLSFHGLAGWHQDRPRYYVVRDWQYTWLAFCGSLGAAFSGRRSVPGHYYW
jgi:hypothetical protein